MNRSTLSKYTNSIASLILSITCLILYFSGVTTYRIVLVYGIFFFLRIGIYILQQKADEAHGYGVGDAFHSMIYIFFSTFCMIILQSDLEAHAISPDLRSTQLFFIIFFAVVICFELSLMTLSDRIKKHLQDKEYDTESGQNGSSHFNGPFSLAALMAAIIMLGDGMGIIIGRWPGTRLLGIVLLAASLYILIKLYNKTREIRA